MQITAIVVSLTSTAIAVVLAALAVRRMLAVIRMGQPAMRRSDDPAARLLTMLKETVLHTRMLQWTWVGILHWFVFAAFIWLTSAVAAGYVQLFDPYFEIPVVGTWYVYGWSAEMLGFLGTLAIIPLIIYRLTHRPSAQGRRSRFFGSTMWQAYFVEFMVLLESVAILFIRAAEYKLHDATALHFPISHFIADWFYPDDEQSLKNIVFFVAMIKITSAMIWLIVLATNLTMGVAWHRFTAWFNIFFKRESGGGTALGAMKPLTSGGKQITLDDLDDLDEDSTLGVGKIEDFSWKGILDFTTCTECGRCQSQCPAWNTEKPLSPKLMITALRDHAYAKAPYVNAGGEGSEGGTLLLEKEPGLADPTGRSLVGKRSDDEQWFYNPEGGDFVIDEDALWSCTSCGACVQQCPVDIEHVDHFMDMRRHQVLVEANFPAELNQLFKGLENKGNPWNMSASARMDWAKDLEFDVPVVGEDLESLESVDWLFWVGCAGAYEDRAKKTTRAVAELLNIAGISFGVLGNGETCTGDPARRAGNEFVFQGLAQQNVETFKEYKVKKVVSTCAHCFNTLRNEYKEFGIELDVVHHTQLLNKLVRDGKLTPIKEGAGAAKRSITYHDPCFLGRHNQVYTPPRELLQILPGAEYVEMERNSEKSFCCGAGGARMWMEENIGERININRTQEAVGTGADQIAVGCPFCRVMLADGLTSEQAKGNAREEVEVLDVAQMLLASVKGEQATKLAPGASAAGSGAAAAAATARAAETDVATKAEPESGDVTVTDETITETADVGPAAKASGGGSLFDESSSLFDTPAPTVEPGAESDAKGTEAEAQAPAEKVEAVSDKAAEPASKPAADLGSGGSLFDLAPPAEEPAQQAEAPKAEAAPTQAPKAEAPQAEAPKAAAPAQDIDLGSGGSLFDIEAPAEPEATAEPEAAQPKPEPQPAQDEPAQDEPAREAPAQAADPAPTAAATGAASEPASDVDISSVGSLFDIEAPAAPAAPEPEAPAEPATESKAEPAGDASGEAATAEFQPEAEAPEPGEAQVEALEAEADTPAGETPAEQPSGPEVSQAASAAAAEDPESIPAAAEEKPAEGEPADEKPVQETPAQETPAASGEAHAPRTDVDINESGSLFDL